MDSHEKRHARARRRQAERQQRSGRPPAAVAVVTLGQLPDGYDALRHNHIRLQMALFAAGKFAPGVAYDIQVLHDDWCGLMVQGGYCDCNCELVVREA